MRSRSLWVHSAGEAGAQAAAPASALRPPPRRPAPPTCRRALRCRAGTRRRSSGPASWRHPRGAPLQAPRRHQAGPAPHAQLSTRGASRTPRARCTLSPTPSDPGFLRTRGRCPAACPAPPLPPHPFPSTPTGVHRPVAAPVLRGDLGAQAGGAQRGLAAQGPVQRRRLRGLAQQHLRRGHTRVRPGPRRRGRANGGPSPHLPLHDCRRRRGGAGRGGRRPEVRLGGRSPDEPPNFAQPGLPEEGRDLRRVGGTVGGGAWSRGSGAGPR